MGNNTFQNYALLAGENITLTEKSGRYPSQEDAEKRIIFDIAEKLDLQPDDALLDIGSGVGQLTIPLSFMVRQVTAIDHPTVLKEFRARFTGLNISSVAGDFVDVEVGAEKYQKVLMYSVIQTVSDLTHFRLFISKAVNALKPGGRFLLGDLPNRDKKKRFNESDEGIIFNETWANLEQSKTDVREDLLLPDDKRVEISDDLIVETLSQYRREGLHVYVLDQPSNLPWGKTREDLLFIKPL